MLWNIRSKNLSDFAFKGPDAIVNNDVIHAIKSTVESKKPIGALCISPVLLAKVLGKVDLTIGTDTGTAQAVEKLGANHINTDHGEVVIDDQNKIFTTPCYMLDATILDIARGASNIVKAMLEKM